MAKFTVHDISRRFTLETDGVKTRHDATLFDTVDYKASADNLTVVCSDTPDVYVLTGSGNDIINTSRASQYATIDAGSGMNFIVTGKANTVIEASSDRSRLTLDLIQGFHAGDCVTLNGQFVLNWADRIGYGATVVATEAGRAPVEIRFLGLAQSQLTTTIGHGGSQFNILERG